MKAQIWSTDFIASVIVFFLIFTTLMISWNYLNQKNAERMTMEEMETAALLVSDTLLRIPGFPENWNESTVQSLGLAMKENVLNESKVKMFFSLDYEKIKELLGLKESEFYLKITELNGSIIMLNGTYLEKGVYPENKSIIVPVERYVLLNSTIAKFSLVLYR